MHKRNISGLCYGNVLIGAITKQLLVGGLKI